MMVKFPQKLYNSVVVSGLVIIQLIIIQFVAPFQPILLNKAFLSAQDG